MTFAALVERTHRALCWLRGGCDVFDDPRFSWKWCVRCGRRWRRDQ